MRPLALLLGAVLLAGCGAEQADVPTEPPVSSAPEPDAPTPVADPASIVIPKIGATSTLTPLGLTDDCPDGVTPPCLAAPPLDQPLQAGWYAGQDPAFDGDEIQPGEVGPAVIAGHVDGYGPDGRKGYPGIFAELGKLAPGDEILVDRKDGSRLRFVVTAVQSYAKARFPTEQVYGPTDVPALRLITCGGGFANGHYLNNEIVWADLAP